MMSSINLWAQHFTVVRYEFDLRQNDRRWQPLVLSYLICKTQFGWIWQRDIWGRQNFTDISEEPYFLHKRFHKYQEEVFLFL
jgi:hypothetical protein